MKASENLSSMHLFSDSQQSMWFLQTNQQVKKKEDTGSRKLSNQHRKKIL